MKKLTLGSLFSGSGGFEVAGILSGIEPIWNSEVLPFAIRVTTKRLPQVRHYGDISKLKSSVIPFSSHLQSFPASRSFPMSQSFTSGGQSIGASASASVLPMKIQD